MYDAEEQAIVDEFLAHAEACRRERARAAEGEGRARLHPLGPVLGRRDDRLPQAPVRLPGLTSESRGNRQGARRRHRFRREHEPGGGVPDTHGAVKEVTFERQKKDEKGKWRGSGEIVPFPARSVLVAAGTAPNII
ncbi:MAG: hypothetical protein MPW15_12610 [Candidatus Manganitrophus sp.]|nr:hypothetical protein [Candidatus Manganitrophus sp.]